MKNLLLLLLPISVFAATPQTATLQKDTFFEGKVQNGAIRILARKSTELPVLSSNAATVTLEYKDILKSVPVSDTDFQDRANKLLEQEEAEKKRAQELKEKEAKAENEKNQKAKEAFLKIQNNPPLFQRDPRTNNVILPTKMHRRIADRLNDPASLVVYGGKKSIVDYYGTFCWKLLLDIGARNKMGGHVRQTIEVYWDPDGVIAVHFPN